MLRLRDPAKLLLENRYNSSSLISSATDELMQKSDVYSFAIILYEIHYRPQEEDASSIFEPYSRRDVPYFQVCFSSVSSTFSQGNLIRPYGDSAMSTREILERVVDPEIRLRPPIDALENCFDFVKSCIKDSWQEDSEDRPDFKV